MVSTQFDYFPKVSPGAIALGTAYSHAVSFIVTRPVFGAAFAKAREAQDKRDIFQNQEIQSAAAVWGSSLTSSGLQTYATSALLKLTATSNYQAASYVGGLVFAVTGLPQIVSDLVLQTQSLDLVLAKIAVGLLDTVGLSLLLTWYGEGNPLQSLQ